MNLLGPIPKNALSRYTERAMSAVAENDGRTSRYEIPVASAIIPPSGPPATIKSRDTTKTASERRIDWIEDWAFSSTEIVASPKRSFTRLYMSITRLTSPKTHQTALKFITASISSERKTPTEKTILPHLVSGNCSSATIESKTERPKKSPRSFQLPTVVLTVLPKSPSDSVSAPTKTRAT